MTTISNEKIIELAALERRVDQHELADDIRQFEMELARLAPTDLMMLRFASKLMNGKPYRVTSDNPESIRRHIALAQEIGATFDDSMDDPFLGPRPGMTSITFFPPSQPLQ
jgi:hypothetical protein